MIRQFRACTTIVIIVLAFSISVVFHATAFALEHYFNAGTQADKDMLHAVLSQDLSDALLADMGADAVLIDRFYENGSIPFVVRLSNSEPPAGFFSDRQCPLSQNTAVLQNRGLGDLVAHTAADVSSQNFRRFIRIPAMTVQGTVDELEVRLDRLNDIDIVDEGPVSPVLQDNNYFGGTQDASIIAVPVVTLFNDETRDGGDLDLYVGLNSLLDEEYEQQYGLLQAGQSFIAGITWTF